MACELQEFGGFLEGISHFPEQLTLYQSRLKEILRPRMDSSLGIDYGTNSVRALIVDCSNGATPKPENQKVYHELYRLHSSLHDASAE